MDHTPKLLIVNEVSEAMRLALDAAGYAFDYHPDISQEKMAQVAGEYDGIVVRSKQIPREVIEAGAQGSLQIIVRAGSGTDNIDKAAARAAGVEVANTPGTNAQATAELAMAMMHRLVTPVDQPDLADLPENGATLLANLCATRQLDVAAAIVRADDRTTPKSSFKGAELLENLPETLNINNPLAGKTLFVAGLGNIGQRVIHMAHASGMQVIALQRPESDHDRETIAALQAELGQDALTVVDRLEDGLARADILSLHVPVKGNESLIGAEQFAAMKPGMLIVNTARPAVIDPDALAEAIADDSVAGAAIDGKWKLLEPFLPLLAQTGPEQLLITPHIGAETHQADEKAALAVVARLDARIGKEQPRHLPPAPADDEHRLGA